MYYCNLTLSYDGVELESSLMCDFVNYHIIMLALFGMISIILIIATAILNAWYGNNPTSSQENFIEFCVGWVVVTSLLSFGIDGAVLIIDIILFLSFVWKVIRFCFIKLHYFVSWSTRFSVSRFIHAIGKTPGQDSNTAAIRQHCPICLETDYGPWFTTPCGHMFHRDCIQRWQSGTCPLCRGMYV